MGIRIRWVLESRWPKIPGWSVGLLGVWAGLVGVVAGLEGWTGREAQTCLFRWATGHPCPTCGSTRALGALVQGRFLEAAVLNPLLVIGGSLGFLLGLIRALSGRVARLESNQALRPWPWWIALAALGANWVWLLSQN